MSSSRQARFHRKGRRVQADVPHTFGTLLIPLAFILVLWGIYMVEHTISGPPQFRLRFGPFWFFPLGQRAAPVFLSTAFHPHLDKLKCSQSLTFRGTTRCVPNIAPRNRSCEDPATAAPLPSLLRG
jgi:hypothetical protein